MDGFRRLTKDVAIFTILSCAVSLLAQDTEKPKAEATVRNYEHACEKFDFVMANALLAKDARWIEDSRPEPAEFNGTGWSKHWEEYRAANMRIKYELHDLDTHIVGDVAWITLILDSTFTADNPAALALNDNQAEWRGTFAETYVLVKTDNVWKVALGHTSLLPKESVRATESSQDDTLIDSNIPRVGPGITAPRPISTPDPVYPTSASDAKREGTVQLWCVIGTDGMVKNIRVIKSLGHDLDESSMTAVRKWRFAPAMKAGEPIAVQINVETTFRLFK